MTKIGLDIDGVLINVIPAFNQAAELFDKVPDWTRYDGGFSPQDWPRIHDCAFISFVERCQPYPGAIEITARWAKYHELYYITSRKSQQGCVPIEQSIQRLTHLQLKQFPAGEVIFAQDKVAVARKLELSVFVEDYLDNAVKLDQFVQCYLIDRPWNRAYYHRRVYSLREVVL